MCLKSAFIFCIVVNLKLKRDIQWINLFKNMTLEMMRNGPVLQTNYPQMYASLSV